MPPRKRVLKAATPSTSPTASLSGLPPELRLRIYKHLFAGLPWHNFMYVDHHGKMRTAPTWMYPHPRYIENSAITLKCRLIHEEASPILWQHPVLLLHVSYDPRGREDSSAFRFTDMKHFCHVRRAMFFYAELDETVSDEEYVARVKELMGDVQYGANFDAIHIAVGDLHTHDYSRVEQTMEIFGEMKCFGKVTVQEYDRGQWMEDYGADYVKKALNNVVQKLKAWVFQRFD
nr:hypothetical protein B0A51_03934 [Rachicladosporium sp. CCFEE 5018]